MVRAQTLFADPAVEFPWRGVILASSADPSRTTHSVDEAVGRPSGGFLVDLPVGAELLPKPKKAGQADAASPVLTAAARRYTGTALVPYVEFLIARRRQLPKMVRAFEAEFAAAVAELNAAPHALPIAVTFGRVFAGARMAMEAGVLPERLRQLTAGLLACFAAAARHAGQTVFSLDVLQRQLREGLESPRVCKLAAGATFGPDAHDGFYRTIRQGRVFTVHARAFRTWFSGRAQCVAIRHWLSDAGHLDMGGRRYSPCAGSTEWAERGPRWPDGRPYKSYVFRDPFAAP